MKASIYILFAGLIYSSCQEQTVPLQSTQVTVLVDTTDTWNVLPDPQTITALYRFAENEHQAAYFRLATTTDMLLSGQTEHYLANSMVTEKANRFDDPNFRRKAVISFTNHLKHSIATFNEKARKDTTTLPYSECFRSIARELTAMVKNRMDTNVLVIYSDLGENSDLLNVYAPDGSQLLQTDQAAIEKRYEETRLLPANLAGFTVLFIFQPPDREADAVFNLQVKMYERMLSRRGAMVEVYSDNPKIYTR